MTRALTQLWPQRNRAWGVWLVVLSLLPGFMGAPVALAEAPAALVAAPAVSDLCCEVEQAPALDPCCAAEAREEVASPCCPGQDPEQDPCCPEGCKQCHRPCCSAPLALIAPDGGQPLSFAAGAQPEPRDQVQRSLRSDGVFHPPRA